MVAKGSGPVHKCGNYNLFVGREMMGVGIEIEVVCAC
jgi:hypothetical protein